MTLEDSVRARRLYALQRARETGNISATCRELGISRTVFYRWKRRFLAYGPDGLHPRKTKAPRGRPSEIPAHRERQVIAFALSWPTWGPKRLSLQLAREGTEISPSAIYRLLRRIGLGTRRERLGVLEAHSAESAGLLTERTRERLRRAKRRPSPHVEAERPGELVCLDCFYIGNLKGVGRVWQLTACDAACSYGAGQIVVLPQPTAAATARFLREVLVPHFRKAGWPIQRVLTDRGSEFKGRFAATCAELGIRHTRTKPRHAWTNGFVERLQGTILHEHWRIEFRRRYFTRRTQLQHSLEDYLRFYNHKRPHSGYRLRGRTPAELFFGASS